VNEKENIERVILRLAKANKGILTVSELALSANITVDEARKVLDAMVSKGFAELRVRKSGTLVYTIPDFMDQDDPLEEF
jgi:predicted transcriptional regulator